MGANPAGMAQLGRVGDLEIDQDLAFQRREWVAERVGWSLMALILVAALLGLFAAGPLGNASATDDSGLLRVEYERFARYKAPTELRLLVGEAAGREGELRIAVSREYLEGVQLQGVSPQPDSVEAGPDVHEFVFRLLGRTGETTITFDLQAERLWRIDGEVALGDAAPVAFGHVVYP